MRKTRSVAYHVSYVALCVALLTVSAWISVPFLIPFTLQTFALFLISAVSGWRKSLTTVCIYLLLGAIGLPVFSGFQGGVSTLFHATGGFLWGFLGSAWITSLGIALLGSRRTVMILSMIAGLLFCYLIGTMWYIQFYTASHGSISLWTAMGYCCLPFLIPDLIKIFLATSVALRLKPRISY